MVIRWTFPFKSLEIAKMYLCTADYSKKTCVIYRIENNNGELLIRFLVVLVI